MYQIYCIIWNAYLLSRFQIMGAFKPVAILEKHKLRNANSVK